MYTCHLRRTVQRRDELRDVIAGANGADYVLVSNRAFKRNRSKLWWLVIAIFLFPSTNTSQDALRFQRRLVVSAGRSWQSTDKGLHSFANQ